MKSPPEVCEGCEWNTGKKCTDNPYGSFEPYRNCCQRVVDLCKGAIHKERLKEENKELKKVLNEAKEALEYYTKMAKPERELYAKNTLVKVNEALEVQ